MNLLNQLFKGTNLLIGFIVLVIIALMIFMFIPTSIYEQSKNKVTRIYFADNISSGHQKLIARFNHRYEGKIEVVPINYLLQNLVLTNERNYWHARYAVKAIVLTCLQLI